MTREARFEILDQFLGYGDPVNARIIFVLIEEAGSLGPSDREPQADAYVERRQAKYLLFEDWEKEGQEDHSRTTIRLRSFAERMLVSQGVIKATDINGHSDFELNQYFAGFVFFSNLWPLPNPRLRSWSEKNSEFLSPYESRADYKKKYINQKQWIGRMKSLHELVLKNRQDPTILFMCKHFLDFEDYKDISAIFGKTTEASEKSFHQENVTKSRQPPGLIFTYHPLAWKSFDRL